ncbi:glycosyltransferase [Oscillatoriales cyanobacterium LEGE 11467]|uniref:Glycosyltransferase n=1 Tax=Zarconia navalis LEGE 11467 TaxID=1828826 RepID=A0A928Z806_9CYAN|nr:glycosyltransferase [Zarconia navalis]MBE9040223.1 glycosyltransferase [Zarconia navalis LEGE 11467]
MTPLTSLVITSYNQSHYLKDAIATILAQTETNFELLIWDDGSTDDSVQVARNIAATDDRVTVVAAGHLGRGRALEVAISQTRGEYIGWVDGDDLLAATALEQTAAILDAQLSVGVVYTDYAEIDGDGKFLAMGKRCQIPYSPQRLLTDFMMFHFRLMRRSVYDRVGGINPRFEYIEDYDLCLRLSEVTQVHHLGQPLYFYRLHRDNTSRIQHQTQIWRSQKAIEQALERRGLAETLKIEVKRGKFCLRRIKPQKTAIAPLRIASWLVPLSLPFIPITALAKPLQPFNAYGIAPSSHNIPLDRTLPSPEERLFCVEDFGFDNLGVNDDITPLGTVENNLKRSIAALADPAVPNGFLDADDTEFLMGEGYGDSDGDGYGGSGYGGSGYGDGGE